MDHRTPARRTMDCLTTLFNGFDSKSGPWGVMQEVYEGRKTLEEIIHTYYDWFEVPDWIPAKKERVEYKDLNDGTWKEGIIKSVVVREGKFAAFVEYNGKGQTACWLLKDVRRLVLTKYE